VKVLSVNTINVHRKRTRERTRFRGYRPGWKKAIVTLAPGDRIEIFEGV
jgi:large subunit ribosomal protein L23